MKNIFGWIMFFSFFFSFSLFAEEPPAYAPNGLGGAAHYMKDFNGYTRQVMCSYARGFYNASSGPQQVYVTMKEYHAQKKGRAGIRTIAGFVDGTFKAVERVGSGIWDFVSGVIPGEQDGLPPSPEVLPNER